MSGRRMRLQAKPNLKPSATTISSSSSVRPQALVPQQQQQSVEDSVSPIEAEPPPVNSQMAHDYKKECMLKAEVNSATPTTSCLPSPRKQLTESSACIVLVEVSQSTASQPTNQKAAAEVDKPAQLLKVKIGPKKFSDEEKLDKSKFVDKPTQLLKAKIGPKKFSDEEKLDKSKFVMKDLIHWNPRNGTALKYDDEDEIPLESTATASSEIRGKNILSASQDVKASDRSLTAAPQVRVAEDGTLIVDESSLTINQTRQIAEFETVRESNRNRAVRLNQNSFRRNPVLKKKFWDENETEKFYRILRMTGTDFSLMAEYFPRRCRVGLKNKFNRECRDNPDKIYNAMTRGPFALRTPKRLKKLEKEKEAPSNDNVGDSDGLKICDDDIGSDDPNAAANPDFGSEGEEAILTSMDKPTRSGRKPKPTKRAELQVNHYKSYNKARVAKKKKLLLEQFASDDEKSDTHANEPPMPKVIVQEMPKSTLPMDDGTTPGPSGFPGYVPHFLNRGTHAADLASSDQQQQRVLTGSGGKQILLVRERAKEVGQPDLVHIYMVDPNKSSTPSSSLDIVGDDNRSGGGDSSTSISQRQEQLVIHNNGPKSCITEADQHLAESDNEGDVIEIDL